VWIAGGGNAEGFKFGPVVGEYIAQRVLGEVGDPKVAEGFRIPKDEYAAPAGSQSTPTPADTGRGRGAAPAPPASGGRGGEDDDAE